MLMYVFESINHEINDNIILKWLHVNRIMIPSTQLIQKKLYSPTKLAVSYGIFEIIQNKKLTV